MKKVIVGLLVMIILAGCVTSPSSLTDLGEESPGRKVSGSATYFGWYGLSFTSKADVYEKALSAAVDNAPEGTQRLGDVKLWATSYLAPSIVIGVVPIVVGIVAGVDEAILTSLVTILVGGVEVLEYTVVGEPLKE